MADKGQNEVFNFQTPGSDFECAIERKEYLPGKSTLSSITFTRKRQGKPDDTVFLWLNTEWLDVIVDAILLKEASMASRKISSIMDDMISQRIERHCALKKRTIKVIDSKLDELKEELEHSLVALVSDFVQGLKETGDIK